MPTREQIVNGYREYLDACNRRDWELIGRCVADSVLVNGIPRSRREYVDDIRATTRSFPDFSWELVRTLVEGEWLAVRLRSAGTRMGEFMGVPGDGVCVETDEFDLYRFVDGLIVEVEGTADNARLRQ